MKKELFLFFFFFSSCYYSRLTYRCARKTTNRIHRCYYKSTPNFRQHYSSPPTPLARIIVSVSLSSRPRIYLQVGAGAHRCKTTPKWPCTSSQHVPSLHKTVSYQQFCTQTRSHACSCEYQKCHNQYQQGLLPVCNLRVYGGLGLCRVQAGVTTISHSQTSQFAYIGGEVGESKTHAYPRVVNTTQT